MRKPSLVVLGSAALVGAVTLGFASSASSATVEIGDGDASAQVTVNDVTRRGDVIAGTLTNRSDEEIRDVRVLIDVAFLWKDETRPGEESPGWSVVQTVAGPIAPRGRLPFEFTPEPPVPERTDGRFADPKIQILGYSSVAVR